MRRIHQRLAVASCVVFMAGVSVIAESAAPTSAGESGGRPGVDAVVELARGGGPRGQGRGRGAYRGRGPGRSEGRGRGPDAQLRSDQVAIHFLLAHHKEIRRTVTRLDDGVETLTESDNPAVTAKIQEHAAAMHKRVKDGKGFRYWDDLFAALFDKHAAIEMEVTNTKQGVKVVETSSDPAAVPLIQAHADVVSLFVQHGFSEARREHAAPKKE